MTRFDNATLERMRAVCDPLADDLVAPLLDDADGARIRALLRSLVDNDQVPPSGLPIDVTDYLDQTSSLPDWADTARIKRGQAVFEEFGPECCIALFCASLPSAYASTKGVHVLSQTAQLATNTRRRILETGQFLVDVMSPDGLAAGGKGVRTIQHVRLMHAAVRHLIRVHARTAAPAAVPPPWNSTWGEPINQEDLAGTLMSFAYVVGEPFPRMGVTLTSEQQNDYLYVWRVIGHMLGVVDDVIPNSIDEASQLVELIRKRNFGHSDDGVIMTQALLALLKQMTPGRVFDSFAPDMMRMLIGDDTADILEVPAKSRQFGFLALLKVLFRISTSEIEQHRVLRSGARHFGFGIVEGMLNVERGGTNRPPFDMPEHLTTRSPNRSRSA